jgi:hypothetical protein
MTLASASPPSPRSSALGSTTNDSPIVPPSCVVRPRSVAASVTGDGAPLKDFDASDFLARNASSGAKTTKDSSNVAFLDSAGTLTNSSARAHAAHRKRTGAGSDGRDDGCGCVGRRGDREGDDGCDAIASFCRMVVRRLMVGV